MVWMFALGPLIYSILAEIKKMRTDTLLLMMSVNFCSISLTIIIWLDTFTKSSSKRAVSTSVST